MKKYTIVAFLFITQFGIAQTKRNPLIKNFGTVQEVPFAVMSIDPKVDYKILIDVITSTDKPENINENVERIASIINLHALGGVTSKKLHVVAVFHGSAVMNLLNNDAYQKKFGVNNPHLALFTALKEAGIPMFVCGQTLFKRNVDLSTIAPEVLPALSAITTITTYASKGYTVLKY